MKIFFDYSLKELKETYDFDFLHGAERYLKERMTNIEDKYFNGQRLYHRKGLKSTYVFRYEIHGLLLLLLKLETDDVLNDNRTKKKGVSSVIIDEILNTYKYTQNTDLLLDHERIVLNDIPNAGQEMKFYNIIKEFQKALTRYLFLVSKNYHTFPNEFICTITNDINSRSGDLSYYSIDYGQKKILSEIYGIPMVALNKHDLTASVTDGTLALDLKKLVVKAILKISESFYDFIAVQKSDNPDKKEWICYRKASLPQDNCFHMNKKYVTLLKKHMRYDSVQQIELSEDDLKGSNTIDSIRMEYVDFLKEYWEEKCRKIVPDYTQKSIENGKSYVRVNNKKEFNLFSNNKEERIRELKRFISEYLDLYCEIKSLYVGLSLDRKQNKEESFEEKFENYARMRRFITEYQINGRKIDRLIVNLENKIWEKCKEKDELISKDDMIFYSDQLINEFIKETTRLKQLRCIEFDYIDAYVVNGKDFIEIKDNIKAVNDISIEIVRNVIAMILKLEAGEKKIEYNKEKLGKFIAELKNDNI